MSGGRFDYLQRRYEWDQAIEEIQRHINENPERFENPMTLAQFEVGLRRIKMARIYLERIDYLLEGDDGEESFNERLKEDIKNANLF